MGKHLKGTQQIIQFIIDNNDKMTISEIAKFFNTGYYCIQRIIKENNIKKLCLYRPSTKPYKPRKPYERRKPIKLKSGIIELMKRIDKKTDNECWNWLGSINNCGYGRLMFNKKVYLAHRLLLIVLNSQSLNGLEVHHLCYNKKCCNPKHLQIVTKQEHKKLPHLCNKWSLKDVEKISQLYKNRISIKKIAKIYSCCPKTISDLLKGKTIMSNGQRYGVLSQEEIDKRTIENNNRRRIIPY